MSFGFLTYYMSNPVQKDRDEVARAPTIKVLCTLSRHGENENTLSYDYQVNAKLCLADVRKSLLKTSIIYDLCKMLRYRNDDVRNASVEAFIRLAKHGTCLKQCVRTNYSLRHSRHAKQGPWWQEHHYSSRQYDEGWREIRSCIRCWGYCRIGRKWSVGSCHSMHSKLHSIPDSPFPNESSEYQHCQRLSGIAQGRRVNEQTNTQYLGGAS